MILLEKLLDGQAADGPASGLWGPVCINRQRFARIMDYQQALLLAMKKEKAAFKLYSALADRAPNAQLKDVFLGLAQEESKHKLRFEIEYDEYVLREN